MDRGMENHAQERYQDSPTPSRSSSPAPSISSRASAPKPFSAAPENYGEQPMEPYRDEPSEDEDEDEHVDEHVPFAASPAPQRHVSASVMPPAQLQVFVPYTDFDPNYGNTDDVPLAHLYPYPTEAPPSYHAVVRESFRATLIQHLASDSASTNAIMDEEAGVDRVQADDVRFTVEKVVASIIMTLMFVPEATRIRGSSQYMSDTIPSRKLDIVHPFPAGFDAYSPHARAFLSAFSSLLPAATKWRYPSSQQLLASAQFDSVYVVQDPVRASVGDPSAVSVTPTSGGLATSTMLDLSRLALRNGYMTEAASPTGWSLYDGSVLVTFAAFFITTLCFYISHRRAAKMYHRDEAAFAFMDLPPELRIRVYENLLEDPYYPPPPPYAKQRGSQLEWMLPESWQSESTPAQTTRLLLNGKHQSNWLFMANKQVYAEYMDILCKKTTFYLSISPYNYKMPSRVITPATTALPSREETISEPAEAENKDPNQKKITATITTAQPTSQTKIWDISHNVLKRIRKFDLKLVASSPMLGVADPRNLQPGDWALGRQIREELKEVENVRELNLHVKAIGDPLWNPLWVWYHTSQSLKMMGTVAVGDDEGAPTGPKLNRIAFSLDTWSPGENYLERDAKHGGKWAWWCLQGHCIGIDGGADLTVREFCAAVYGNCSVCRPDLAGDSELEDVE
ncbi:hypothetical protein P280DRAFT_548585 [Massarina eburnea CBS 473.64]|uniref:Uncharacterized protein n=1 Tax=Massarina eburnea CBS 473.64 TaxID=1395130 RepID=A0A6A6S4B5_9PLEO|nr:hypothetical protein P280DRAFT_548585 [Massarina eburnea CBS 473.64]